MKICPVCDAVAFDDASTCYGCLHAFDHEDPGCERQSGSPSGMPEPENPCAEPERPPQGQSASSATFLITLTPRKSGSGLIEWSCSVSPLSPPS